MKEREAPWKLRTHLMLSVPLKVEDKAVMYGVRTACGKTPWTHTLLTQDITGVDCVHCRVWIDARRSSASTKPSHPRPRLLK